MSIHGQQAEKYANEGEKSAQLKGTRKTHSNLHQNLKIPGAAANLRPKQTLRFLVWLCRRKLAFLKPTHLRQANLTFQSKEQDK